MSDEGLLNNNVLVAFAYIELEVMKHVFKIHGEKNMDCQLFLEIPRNIEKLPSYSKRGIFKWINLAENSSYPVSMLDSLQKPQFHHYIEELGYEKVHEVARQSIAIWKSLNLE